MVDHDNGELVGWWRLFGVPINTVMDERMVEAIWDSQIHRFMIDHDDGELVD
jgi:hypothetical protein